MTVDEYAEINELNYEIVCELSKIADKLISTGEIVSDTKYLEKERKLLIKKGTFIYQLFMYDVTCLSIKWQEEGK